MAILFSNIILIAIGVIVGLIFTIIGIFLGHIILFDSILLSVISGISCSQIWGIHPAFSLLIGIAIFGLLFWLQNTKVGFWIIGILLSFLWAFVFGFFAYAFSGSDMIWAYVVMGLGFIIMIGLHLKAKNN